MGVAANCPDDREHAQLSRQEFAENVRTITLHPWERSHGLRATTWPTHLADGQMRAIYLR